MNINDFKPGQTVYILYRERPVRILERNIKSVGRKYVTLAGNWVEQYFLRNETEGYLTEKVNIGCPNYLFATKEAADLYLERQDLELKIRRNITNVLSRMPMDQIRQIADWMDKA